MVHLMFFDLYRVDGTGNKSECMLALCVVTPLENGIPFKVVKGREIWHPVWNGKINDIVNTQFIKAVIDHVWDNKEVSI